MNSLLSIESMFILMPICPGFQRFPYDVVFMGHTHRPFIRWINGKMMSTLVRWIAMGTWPLSPFMMGIKKCQIYRVPFDIDDNLHLQRSLDPSVIACLHRTSPKLSVDSGNSTMSEQSAPIPYSSPGWAEVVTADSESAPHGSDSLKIVGDMSPYSRFGGCRSPFLAAPDQRPDYIPVLIGLALRREGPI